MNARSLRALVGAVAVIFLAVFFFQAEDGIRDQQQ